MYMLDLNALPAANGLSMVGLPESYNMSKSKTVGGIQSAYEEDAVEAYIPCASQGAKISNPNPLKFGQTMAY